MTQPATSTNPTEPTPAASSEEKKSSFCGRCYSKCDCISSKTLYMTALIVGVILLVLGILGIMGHCASPTTTSPLLQKLNSALNFVATQTGSDPLVLISVTTAFGASFTFAGAFGLRLKSAQENLVKK